MRHRHWRRVGSRAADGKPEKQRGLERLLLLFLSSPAVKVTATCNKRNNAQTTVDFKFFSLVSNLFLFSLLLRFKSASPYKSVLFRLFPILLGFRWRQVCKRGRPATELRCEEESCSPATRAVRYPLDRVDHRPFFLLQLAVRRQREIVTEGLWVCLTD